MPRRVQNTSPYEQQFQNIFETALDKNAFVEVTAPATPDEEFEVKHGLGYVAPRFLVISKDRAADIYLGATAPSADTLYLKCTTAGAVLKIMIF